MKKYTRETPIAERILSFLELEDGWHYGYRYEPRGSAFKLEELQRLVSRLEAVEIPNKGLLSIMPGTTEPGEDSEVNFDWEWSLKDVDGKIPVDGIRYVSMDINITKSIIELTGCVENDVDIKQTFQQHEWKDAFALAAKYVPK